MKSSGPPFELILGGIVGHTPVLLLSERRTIRRRIALAMPVEYRMLLCGRASS